MLLSRLGLVGVGGRPSTGGGRGGGERRENLKRRSSLWSPRRPACEMIRTLIKNDYILIEPFLLTSPRQGRPGLRAGDGGWGPGPTRARASARPRLGGERTAGAGGEVLGVVPARVWASPLNSADASPPPTLGMFPEVQGAPSRRSRLRAVLVSVGMWAFLCCVFVLVCVCVSGVWCLDGAHAPCSCAGAWACLHRCCVCGLGFIEKRRA